MIRTFACSVAALSVTAGILFADAYNPSVPGASAEAPSTFSVGTPAGAPTGPPIGPALGIPTGAPSGFPVGASFGTPASFPSVMPAGASCGQDFSAGTPMMSSGMCQSCPSGVCQQGAIPGGMVVNGACPTCPTMNTGSWCPSSCPTMYSCDSCSNSCCKTWCIKTKICCWDNTFQMPPHYPYAPACHGHYYFAPYNYQTALKQKEYARYQNQDPRFPYSVPTFEHSYGEAIGDREEPDAGEDLIEPKEGLPDLEEILNRI